MKNNLISAAILVACCLIAFPYASYSMNFSENVHSEIRSAAVRTVRVVMIKGYVTNHSKSGSYNDETNMITIDGGTYRVYPNPYANNENDKRSGYSHYANGIYFFNL